MVSVPARKPDVSKAVLPPSEAVSERRRLPQGRSQSSLKTPRNWPSFPLDAKTSLADSTDDSPSFQSPLPGCSWSLEVSPMRSLGYSIPTTRARFSRMNQKISLVTTTRWTFTRLALLPFGQIGDAAFFVAKEGRTQFCLRKLDDFSEFPQCSKEGSQMARLKTRCRGDNRALHCCQKRPICRRGRREQRCDVAVVASKTDGCRFGLRAV